MKIIVTGGAGFIGSNVADKYLELGHEVLIVDDLSTGRRSNINPDAKFIELDIRSDKMAELIRDVKPDIINHHGAQMNARKSVDDPVYDAEVNILAPIKMLEACKDINLKKFIHISSGGTVYGEPLFNPVPETHSINPVCQYGLSKFVIEKYLQIYRHLYGLNYIVFRYPNIFGPRQDPYGEAGVIAIFIRQMLKGEQILINGDGKQERDFVFIADIVDANVRALQSDFCGVINLGTGKGTSVNKLFDIMAEYLEYNNKPVYRPAIPGETRFISLDPSKALNELEWLAITDVKEAIIATIEYFKQNEKENI